MLSDNHLFTQILIWLINVIALLLDLIVDHIVEKIVSSHCDILLLLLLLRLFIRILNYILGTVFVEKREAVILISLDLGTF